MGTKDPREFLRSGGMTNRMRVDMTKPNVLTEISEDNMFRFHDLYEFQANECWSWTGRIATNGYGRMVIDGKQQTAHRVSYFLRHGAIDPEMVIDHLCRNRACVNPDHLEQVTQKTNVRRGDLAVRLRTGICALGHSITGENAMPQGKKANRTPICRSCNRDYMREYMRNRTRRAVTA